MRMNFYRYQEEVKQAIIERITQLDSEWDPFTASWLAYALSQDGIEANPSLFELIKRLALWANENEAWTAHRNLGALCFLGYLLTEMDRGTSEFMARVLEQIEHLNRQGSHKFSPVNDPEQVFPVALLVGFLKEAPKNVKDLLKKAARERMQGTLKRQILYGAALRELGEVIPVPTPSAEDLNDSGNVIALVWYWERYGEAPGERAQWWGAFEAIKDGLAFDQNEMREGTRILTVSEVALLYEALTRETANPDPNLLFELYPFHPRVREISASLFKNGEYNNAVEEAAKALNAFIQDKTGSRKAEADLVQSVMKSFPPPLQFNPYLDTDSGKNEQAGLALIAEGVFKALRNPKAHSPKDIPQVQIDALEALDQLAIISYIFKRVERAQVETKHVRSQGVS